MKVKSIPNRIEPLKYFVYQRAEILEVEGTPAVIQVEIVPRANGGQRCSGRGKKGPKYDRLSPHRLQNVA